MKRNENDHISQSDFCQRYKIARSTLHDWLVRYEKGEYMHYTAGRPRFMDSTSSISTKGAIKERQDSDDPMDVQETDRLIIDGINGTRKRRNQISIDPHPDTVKKYKDMLEIHDVRPQITSNARFKACSDVRMSYAMWIMLKAYTYYLKSQMIWNFDATQFVCRMMGSGKLVCTIVDRDQKRPTAVIGDDPLAIAVKWLHMGSASGDAAPLVLLVATPDMKEEEFEVFTIRGLSHMNSGQRDGYVVFCKTRAGNAKFFNWYVTNIAVPTVVATRDYYECKVCGVC